MKELRFDRRVALITGGGRGLGRSYARLLSARGARVVVNDLGGSMMGGDGDPGVAEEVVHEIRANGGEAVADTSSVTDVADAEAMVQRALDTWGRLDIVVNNAGVGATSLSPPEMTERAVATHLLGTINVLRAAVPAFEAARYARVVNTSSGSIFGMHRTGDYAAAKGGVLALTRVLATDFAARPELDVKVNAVLPVAATRMASPSSDPDHKAMMEQVYPPERVAAFVAVLCHEQVPCSGEAFVVGGGRAARVLLLTTAGHHTDTPTPEDYLAHFDDVMAGEDPRESMGGLSDLLGRTPGAVPPA